mmetsp:Transcript_16299/g.21440  ORF Transcript_16299/g.21440 Transcript_16299/m.21440 type:complete len:99 (-) Transcript_16299:270-566(-)|eukprot:CAMPEP_0195246064 /NCGR_PEP_ID=MMETSP0706-20130129/190_1 /TAXON_ID=33640 /ORGANISM="Asterionellopsis glacialis, Strain CCMP134" /LENGTH=98 /DNA_ID=CAMNT_0040297389 /DNA_START=73 /DNA_END=369 /DNA_ORIENTATION=-
MTYRSRGRSVFEVVLAICFVTFLVGFITVLCIGNYFRAKRAQERQRQRRLQKVGQEAGSAHPTSSRSGYATDSSYPSAAGGGSYEAPSVARGGNGVSA